MGQARYLPAAQIDTALLLAMKNNLVVAAMLTSAQCPFCIAIKKEQLGPRMLSKEQPELVVVEFDVDDTRKIQLPDNSRVTAREWGQRYNMKLTPTVVMLDPKGRPIGSPLVGYASRDFYATYLEEHIQAANRVWQNARQAK